MLRQESTHRHRSSNGEVLTAPAAPVQDPLGICTTLRRSQSDSRHGNMALSEGQGMCLKAPPEPLPLQFKATLLGRMPSA